MISDPPRYDRSTPPFRRWRWLLGVFAASLAVRVVVLWSWQRSPLAACLGADPQSFMASAHAIASGRWAEPHGVMAGGPLYPYFLGALVRVMGPELAPLRLAQAVVGSVGTALVAALGERLFSRTTGIIAAIGTAACGPLVANELGFENEFLAVPIVAGALLLLAGGGSRRRIAGAGLLLGFAALLRGNQALVAGLALAWLLTSPGAWRERARHAALLLAGAAVAILPVAARNIDALGEAVPLGAHGGFVFFLGNHEGASWRYEALDFGDTSVEGEAGAALAEARRRTNRELSPGEASAYWYAEGLRHIAAHPAPALRNAGLRSLAFFQGGELPDNYDFRFLREEVPPLRLLLLSFAIIAPLAALGLLGLRERRQLLPLLPPAAAFLTSVLFYYNARFRLPALPFLILFAAEGARLAHSWLRARDTGRLLRGAVAAGAGLSLVVLAPGFRDDFYFPWVLLADCSAASAPGRAESLYRRAMELHPREPEARLGLASLLSGRGDLSAARHLLTPLPRSAPALVMLAAIEVDEGRMDAAIAWLEAALALEPALASAWNDLGVLHARSGRRAEALACFERALALDAGQLDARRNAGTIRLEMGR